VVHNVTCAPIGAPRHVRSSASGSPALRPHWGQEGERSSRGIFPREGAPHMRRIVVRARGVDALRSRGVSNRSMATLPSPKWERSLARVEGGGFCENKHKVSPVSYAPHTRCHEANAFWRTSRLL
jgi:hypothetical protein